MKIRKIETNFTQVSNLVLNDPQLSWKAKGVFAYLYSKPDDYDFSSDRAQSNSSEGRKSLLSGLKELEEAGYLRRKRLSTGKMEYLLDYKPESPKGTEAQKPKSSNGTKPIRHVAQTALISNTDINTNTDKESNTDSEREENIYPEAFCLIWEAYPKKVGKGEALKAWKKIKPSKTLNDKILSAIETYKKTKQWRAEDGRFIPNPATFLNQRRFDDTPEAGKLDTGASSDKYKGL